MRVLPVVAAVSAFAIVTFASSTAFAQSARLVISQVYGGGGSVGAPYARDYVELFNGTNATINLAGYTLQYASPSGNFNATDSTLTATLTGSIPSGRFFLIGLAFGAGNGVSITQDFSNANINAGAVSGKFALANSTATVTFTAPNTFSGNVVDFVGYGSATAYEGASAVAALGNATAAVRKTTGNPAQNFADSNSNGNDFTATTTFAPSNSSSANPFGANFVPSAVIPETNTFGLLACALPTIGAVISRRRR